jgi:general secretion pathway protein G
MTIILYRVGAKLLTPLPGAFQLIYGLKALLESVSKERIGGFTLLELSAVIGIISTLSAIAIPSYQSYIEKARITKAIAEIRIMDKEIFAYEMKNEELPDTLSNIGRGKLKDPWDHPYQYLNFENISGSGKMRKDRFMVPLNTDYDLYSMGKDGKSKPPLTATPSHDDIIRANNGSFVGKATDY